MVSVAQESNYFSDHKFEIDNKYLYRYHEYEMTTGVTIFLTSFKILRETPKGVWIEYCPGEKFILNNSLRSYAHRTREAALEHFKQRKFAQIRIVTKTLKRAEEALLKISNKKIHIENFNIAKATYQQKQVNKLLTRNYD